MRLHRREFLQLMGGAVGFMALRSLCAWGNTAEQKPNIILCMADDQGWGDVGYNGHPYLKTPNLDALSAEGLRFDRFYAAAPVCSPTRGSVMTGRHPNRYGCFKWGYTLRPQEITIAEAIKTVGYVTGHFGKWHLGSVRKGSPVNPGESGFDEWLSTPNFYGNDPILSHKGVAVQKKGESSMVAAEAAIEFMRQYAKLNRPFLAVVWLGSPHLPHEAIEKDRSLYGNLDKKLQNFYGEITGLDRAVGKLRNELNALGIRENTIFWYCSDNGGLPQVGATGGRGQKGQIYEGGLRVPAILEWPEYITSPRRTQMACNTCDIYPTLVDIVGVKVKKQPPLDGISLVPLIEGKMNTRSKPMGFWDYPIKGIRTPSKEFMTELLEAQKEGNEVGDKSRLRLEAGKISKQYAEDTLPGHAAWLDWPWKLHRIENKKGIKWELYQLETDPEEKNNLADEQIQRVETMKVQLEAWQKSLVQSLNGKDY